MPAPDLSQIRILKTWVLLFVPLCVFAMARPVGAQDTATRERSLRVEKVEITGAWKTREPVVIELLGLKAGDVLNPDLLLLGRERLLRSGFFHSVEISTRAGEARGNVVLELHLRERHRPYIDTGFGYRDTGGWYLNLVSLRAENPLGFGGRSTLGLQLGFRTAGAVLESWLPLRADASIALRLRLSALTEQRIWYEEEPGWDGLFDEYRLGLNRNQADLTMEWRPLSRVRFSLGLSGVKTGPKDEGVNRDSGDKLPIAELPPLIGAESDAQSLHGLLVGFRLGEGGMDGKPGHSLSLAGRLVGPSLGADREFSRWTFALRSSYRIFHDQDLAFGLRTGRISGDAPWYERFHLGGSYSLRGFRDHSLSPLAGHADFWTVSGEYRFPLTSSKRTRLGGLVFFDAGRAGGLPEGEDYEIDFESLQMGMGYGIRLELPWVGVLGLDVGVPVTRGVTGESVWVYLTLGQSF